ncbi:hypothetical protein ACIBIZ_12025 [Nonomuraea spiralis]|uniref:hypothetical protein n=1 Tax=Nonomuraea TaxID=83681 RepID=UPI00163D367F|nr:hypothetical protein [Nonomuraea sp. WAC 01424]
MRQCTYDERFDDAGMWAPKQRGTVPTAVAVFPMDFPVRPSADRAHNLTRWPELGRGAHFAALETPDLLIADLRAFFRSLD